MWQRSDGVVRLARFVPADAPVLFVADADPEHRRRFDIPDDFVPSLAHAQAVISRWEQEYRSGRSFPFAVRSAVTGELLGGCELRPLDAATANLSYWTYPAYRRRGIAVRASVLVCGAAFDELGFRRIEVLIDVDNIASRKVAQRSGFREVGQREGRVLHVLNFSHRSDPRSCP